ncbi:MAG TPA: DinB family protein [Candidatus Xenobia bacterium]|nr:DinB family protein [Candidatus Xenobia bacterium]
MKHDKELRQQLARLLDWQDAHLNFGRVVAGWPVMLRGVKPRGAPHTGWQLVEHLRICQWDILDFCRNPNYKEMPYENYWPRTAAPPSALAWEKSLRGFRADNQAMQKLILNPKTDLYAAIPWGSGQTILREAVLVADHNAYHVGQLVLLRKQLGIWKS